MMKPLKPKIETGWKRMRGGRVRHYWRGRKSLCGVQLGEFGGLDRSPWDAVLTWPRCSGCQAHYDKMEKVYD